MYLRKLGNGRVTFLPGDIDRTFWEVLDPDHGTLVANMVRWALNEPDVVSVSGPGVLDIAVWQQEGSMTVHLVNLTNPMMMKGPIRELISDWFAAIEHSPARRHKPSDVRLLVSKSSPKTSLKDGVLAVTVPSITDHEVVAVVF